MAKVLINESTLSNMADEIRTQKGIQDTMTPDEMVTEVANIGESATAIASDIANGKTAITSSGLVTGTNTNNVSVGSFLNLTGDSYCSLINKAITNVENVDFSGISSIEGLFTSCSSLRSVPLIDTNNFTNMNGMFRNCISLETIPLINTENMTHADSMFAYCSDLKTIPLINTEKLEFASNMFAYCRNLETVPLLNTQKLKTMSYMFANCENKLEEIPLFNTQNVENMSYAFRRCLKLITVPLLNTSKVIDFTNAFQLCNSLSSESLNNILAMCVNATSYTGVKTLTKLGLNSTQKTTCQSLSNYQDFVDAGWTL